MTEWKDHLTFQWWNTTSDFLFEGRPCFTLYLTDGVGLNLIQYGGGDWRVNLSRLIDEDPHLPLEADTFVEAKKKSVEVLRELLLLLTEREDCSPLSAKRLKEVADHLLAYDETLHGEIV